MKKSLLAVAVAGAVLLSSAVQAQTTPEGYQLQQVLMMSRHNLRAPLANNGSVIRRRKLPKPFLKSLTMTRNWQKKYGKKVAMRC